MGIKTGGIVGDLTNSNMQKSMRSGNIESEITDNFTLAMYFYNYLVGRSDKLPSYEYIDEISVLGHGRLGSRGQEVISIGCGISVYSYKFNDKKFLEIEYEEPINKSTSRIEKISSNNHDAYAVNLNAVSQIDVDEFPVFEKQRVLVFQNYLRNYTLKPNIENSKNK